MLHLHQVANRYSNHAGKTKTNHIVEQFLKKDLLFANLQVQAQVYDKQLTEFQDEQRALKLELFAVKQANKDCDNQLQAVKFEFNSSFNQTQYVKIFNSPSKIQKLEVAKQALNQLIVNSQKKLNKIAINDSNTANWFFSFK